MHKFEQCTSHIYGFPSYATSSCKSVNCLIVCMNQSTWELQCDWFTHLRAAMWLVHTLDSHATKSCNRIDYCSQTWIFFSFSKVPPGCVWCSPGDTDDRWWKVSLEESVNRGDTQIGLWEFQGYHCLWVWRQKDIHLLKFGLHEVRLLFITPESYALVICMKIFHLFSFLP